VGNDAVVCEGNSFQLIASGGSDYTWSSSDGTFSSTQPTPSVQPKLKTSYFVTVVDANGCSKKDTLVVNVIQNVRAGFNTNNLNFSKPGYNNVCYPDSIRFKNLSVNGENFSWDFDDGTIVTKTRSDTVSLFHGFRQQGVYSVKLKAFNLNTCNKVDSVIKTINYFREQIEVGDDGEICEGTTFQLTATGGSGYAWSTKDGTFTSSIASPVVQPVVTTQYFVTATNANSCVRKDTVQVTVLDSVDLKWQHRFIGNCLGSPSVFVQNLTPLANDVTFHVEFGDGTTSTETSVEHVYEKDGLYSLKFIAQRKFCSFEEVVDVPIYKLFVPNVFTPDDSPGYNDNFEIVFGADMITPANLGMSIQLIVMDRWGKKVFESQDYKNDWNANGVHGGTYYFHLKVGDLANCKSWVHIMK
jgi:PKD repeat protein